MVTSRIPNELVSVAIVTAMMGIALFGSGDNAKAGTAFDQDQTQLIGNWTGDSICQVKNSPCHDEKVVYHIAKGSGPDHLTIRADKIVDGKAIDMGTGDYTYDRGNGTLVNEAEGRVWRFTVNGNVMEGTLTMPDRTVYRKVNLKKEK